MDFPPYVRANNPSKMLPSNPRYLKFDDMVSIVSGKTAIEIVNTLIRYKYISSLQHAADMGIELCKAELALEYKLNYIQDKNLEITRIKK